MSENKQALEMVRQVYKYILVDLLDDVEIKTHIFDDYHQENMINLYGDLTDDDQICIQLEYIYDDRLEYGFDANNPHISKAFIQEANETKKNNEFKYRWEYLGEPIGSGVVPFSNLEFREFLKIRLDDFNPDFIEKYDYTPDRYREKYIREIKVLRK